MKSRTVEVVWLSLDSSTQFVGRSAGDLRLTNVPSMSMSMSMAHETQLGTQLGCWTKLHLLRTLRTNEKLRM